MLGAFLEALSEASGLFPWPIPYTETWRFKQMEIEYKSLRRARHHLKSRGLVEEVSIKGKKFLKLTAKGELELLLKKAGITKTKVWDGKWRMVVFDIPESAKIQRNFFRQLLKQNNFVRLQNSVFVSPYPLNREAIAYLKQSGLMEFIRLAKVEEFDADQDLKAKFELK